LTPAVAMPGVDVKLCLQGGQTFGWREAQPGGWEGADGGSAYRFRQDGGRLVVERGDAGGLARFFGVGFERLGPARTPAGHALSRLVPGLPGLRLLRCEGALQSLVCFLCTANNHLVRIDRMVEALFALGPVAWEGEGGPVRLFPAPGRIVSAGAGRLRAAGFGYRAEQVVEACRRLDALGGEAYLAGLRKVAWHEAEAKLAELPGVGPKVAACASLYGLGHGESVPVDTHVWRVGAPLFAPELDGMPPSPSRSALLAGRIREEFGPGAGLAQLALFAHGLVASGSRRGWARVESSL
jgi:N-glycosylase/DNA lyase